MTTRRSVTWAVACDLCGCYCREAKVEGKAEEKALRSGWVTAKLHYVGIWGHLCPECKRTPPDWWPEGGSDR